jgi:hypothetical protein
MQRHPSIASAAAALLLWALPASAELPRPEPEIASAYSKAPRLRVPAPPTWFLIEARNHATGASGAVAMLFGIAQERGRSRRAILRVDCFEGRTTVQIDAPGLRLGASGMAVRQSLDGGPLVSASWDASADGSGLELSDERAIAFLAGLYGKSELRLALVQPLSVPLWFTFAVNGAEATLGALAGRCHWPGAPPPGDADR